MKTLFLKLMASKNALSDESVRLVQCKLLMIYVCAVQILREPDTFRDHAKPEIQQLFDRARAGCLSMWHEISNASSHNIKDTLATDRTAKAN